MADYDTFILFGAVYDSQEVAEMDYEAVKSLYDWQLIDTFDAAIVAKREDGKVKIVKKHEQPTLASADWLSLRQPICRRRSMRLSRTPARKD